MPWICSRLSRICLFCLFELWHFLEIVLMTKHPSKPGPLNLVYRSSRLPYTRFSVSAVNSLWKYCSRSRSTYRLRLSRILLKSLPRLACLSLHWRWPHIHDLLSRQPPAVLIISHHATSLQLLWKLESWTPHWGRCLSGLGRIPAKLAGRLQINQFLPASIHSFSLAWVADWVLCVAGS